MPLCVSSI